MKSKIVVCSSPLFTALAKYTPTIVLFFKPLLHPIFILYLNPNFHSSLLFFKPS